MDEIRQELRDFTEAFVAAFFPATMERKVRAEELAAVPGQVECSERHDDSEQYGHHFVAVVVPCPRCGAIV